MQEVFNKVGNKIQVCKSIRKLCTIRVSWKFENSSQKASLQKHNIKYWTQMENWITEAILINVQLGEGMCLPLLLQLSNLFLDLYFKIQVFWLLTLCCWGATHTTKPRDIPEDLNLEQLCCENLKSHNLCFSVTCRTLFQQNHKLH
jgi:hypothetical protein